jgi:hypothetical protein
MGADFREAIDIINIETSHISVCSTLDKVLIDSNLPELENFREAISYNLRCFMLPFFGRHFVQMQRKFLVSKNDLIWH